MCIISITNIYIRFRGGSGPPELPSLAMCLTVGSSPSSSEYSAQGQVLHCKLRNQRRSSARRQVFHRKLRNPGCILLWVDRYGSFPLLSAPQSLSSIWTNLKISEKIPGVPAWRWRDWIWLTGGLRTPPKFTTGVKYQFHHDFSPDERPLYRVLTI